jgi:uncharacterized protein (UPF0262 family)
MSDDASSKRRLVAVVLDEESIGRGNPDQEHERLVAIYDLVEINSFALPGHDGGPYALHISLHDKKLCFDVRANDGEAVIKHIISLSPFRRLLKDYFLVCESYYAAIRTATPAQIEAIDMGRRGLHNEGAQLLLERLAGKVAIDFPTARRLFTLVCVLHQRS